MPFDVEKIKKDFPIFSTYPNLVYLDSASTSQKPQIVIDQISNFYTTKNSNIHRGIYHLAEEATSAYEDTRKLVKNFINAYNDNEIIFTQNTNESINFAAFGWARKFLKAGDVIILSDMEHHANIVPWLRLKEEKDIKLFFLPVDKYGRLFYEQIEKIDRSKIKLVALTHISNVLGTVNPLEELIPYFKNYAPDAKILIDAAQAIAHIPIDVQKLQIDFLAFSSHKMFGPSGVGVLWSKEEILNNTDPFLVGSNMISKVTRDHAQYAKPPAKFEAGTPNLEGVVGLGTAIKYIQKIGFEDIMNHDNDLTVYALEKFKDLEFIKLYGPVIALNRIGIFSFSIPKIHPHDIAQILDESSICIRSGHHCCQVLMDHFQVPAMARASLHIYNTQKDIDLLTEGLKSIKKTFKI